MTRTTATTEEAALLGATARSYFAGFVDNAYLNEQERAELGYEPARWKQMGDLGWTAVNLPARVGGSDGTLADAAVIAREAGRAAFASPLLPAMRTATALDTLNLGDTGGAFDGILTRVANGETAALVAPPDRTVRAAARDGGYVLSGAPAIVEWLTAAGVTVALLPRADADTWLCAAWDRERPPPGSASMMSRQVPVRSVDNERSARLDLDRAYLPADQVLAAAIPARDAEYALARANLLRAAVMVGGAEAVLERTAEYAKQREQFGRPIGAFQAVRHHLARMVIAVDAARLSCDEAVNRATLDADESAFAAVALFAAGRSYVEVVLTAAQLHGGVGTTTEHVLHHHFRRAKAMQLRSGNRANRLREITEALVRRREGSLW